MTSSTAAEFLTMAGAQSRATLEEQFGRLLSLYQAALTRLAGSYTDSAGDREDLLQEIAMNLWQALPGFRGECSERTFVFRIAHNRAITYLSRGRRRPQPAGDELELADLAPSPEAEVVRGQQGERLTSAVRSLPLPYRQVVTMVLEEMDYGEIARVLGITVSNVGARLTRARQMLRQKMESGT